MSASHISRSLRQEVIGDFGRRCAYCQTAIAITGARLVIDHIIPESAGGETLRENLCSACHSCNEFKGAQVLGIDPITGQSTPLFHPRQQRWHNHFRWSEDGTQIVGISPMGRATVIALNMNHLEIVEARRRWTQIGWHPPVME